MHIRTPPHFDEDLQDKRRKGDASASALDALTPEGSLEVQALARRVFGDDAKADAWLNRPNPSMAGQIPRDLLKDFVGVSVVRETLEQIDNGIFA